MKVQELTNGKFEEFTKSGTVIIDFFADWCMPCMMMSPVIDTLAKKYEGKIKFGKVDISENQEIAGKYGVSSIPNFLVLKDGKVIDQFVGSLGEEDLENKIKSVL